MSLPGPNFAGSGRHSLVWRTSPTFNGFLDHVGQMRNSNCAVYEPSFTIDSGNNYLKALICKLNCARWAIGNYAEGCQLVKSGKCIFVNVCLRHIVHAVLPLALANYLELEFSSLLIIDHSDGPLGYNSAVPQRGS